MPQTATDLGPLPEWDLSDLYSAMDAPEIQRDLDASAARAAAFKAAHEGKLGELDGDALAAAVAEYEAIDETLSRLASYAQLVYARDMSDATVGKFYQSIQERTSDIGRDLLFFTLELNRIDDDALADKLKAATLAHYKPWIDEVRAQRPYQLSDEIETLLHDKHVAGRAAWVRLFDETLAEFRFEVDGQKRTLAEVLDLMSDPQAGMRKKAAKSLGAVLSDNQRLLALITNTLAKDKQIEDRWRGFKRPVSGRNVANRVEDEVVDALVSAVESSYDRLSHRYYKLKAGMFGQDRLDYWDRNAPLPGDDNRRFQWTEARDIVLDAYSAFTPEMADLGRRFFDTGWIDAPVRPGKASGAFAHPTVPSAHPYLLLNYQGKTDDVMTLAHELGHGVHQILAGGQGHLMADTPLTLAETASVFGEMLTFRSLLAQETDPARRRIMLAGKVEDMLNTVIRQIAFHRFETLVHDERKEGELTTDRLGELWMRVQEESLGPALRFDDDYRAFWGYIPHFIHSPFYVYAYAFGDCLVNSLYAVYQDAEKGFAERYLDMLRAGGTLRHKELLAPFGLDASDPDFWMKGLSLIGDMIDEIEAL